MKILVPIKRVVDYHVNVQVKADQSAMDIEHVKMSMNPFDEIALEEAITLKEKNSASEVIAMSIGTEKSQETLRQALAMGADKALLITTEHTLEPITLARIIHHIAIGLKPQLIMLGKQAIDNDCNQTGQMLAALLDWPQATFISELNINDNSIEVTREIDEGIQQLRIQLPAVVTADLRLNIPRLTKLPDIVKAKKKPLDTIDLNAIPIEMTRHTKIHNISTAKKRQRGKIVESCEELIAILQREEVI